MYDADDIVDMKNRKKRLKRLRKLLIFLLIAAIGAALYITRDKWYNKLRGIGKQYRTIVNSGQLAEGNFPIDVNGGEDYQVDLSEDTLVILSDTYTYYYDTDGFSKSVSTPIQIPLCAQRGTAFSFMRTAERI